MIDETKGTYQIFISESNLKGLLTTKIQEKTDIKHSTVREEVVKAKQTKLNKKIKKQLRAIGFQGVKSLVFETEDKEEFLRKAEQVKNLFEKEGIDTRLISSKKQLAL